MALINSKEESGSTQGANGHAEEEVYVMPASYSQERFWYVGRLYGQTRGVNVVNAYRIWGNLHIDALEQSFNEVMRRHEILRTSLVLMDGNLVQLISPEMRIPFAQIDLSDLNAEGQSAQVKALITEESKRPFDLKTAPLIRVVLVRLAAQEHILLFNIHHSVTDYRSMDLLVKELNILYGAFSAGQPSPLLELPIQYADYALWERQTWQAQVLENSLSYWRRRLEGMKGVLDIPADRPRPATPTFVGSSQTFELPASLSHELRELSQRERVTPYMTLLAAFSLLLQRYTGENDLPIGSQYLNRNHPRVNNLIGCFENPFVLRQDLSGNPTFLELLSRVREVNTSAYAHADLPFVKLVEDLNPRRDPSYNPLFQVDFFTLSEMTPLQLGDCEVANIQIESAPWVDLSITVLESGESIHGNIIYSTDLFDGDTIKRMFDHYRILLEGIVTDPDQRISELPLLTEAERHQLLVEWNDTRADFPQDTCIHQLFEAQVERTPDGVAVVYEGKQLTYGELNRRANQLAHHLRGLGVGPEVPVGICIERSLDMVVGLLAILKAGGACVPLDPAYPKERLAFMLQDTQAPVLLTQQRLADSFPNHRAQLVCLDSDWQVIAQESQENLVSGPTSENLVYVIYTSGSTGKPKGTALPHRALTNLISWQLLNSTLSVGARTLQLTSLSFDVSFQEIFATWCSGGTLVLIAESLRRDMGSLACFLAEQGIERVFLPFVALQQLAEAMVAQEPRSTSLKEVITAGEQLQATEPIIRLFTQLQECTLHNHYGPSESHVVTGFTLADTPECWPTLPPIGRPIANTQIYLLDPKLNPVPIGVPGELCIGGECLARGYLNRPDLTAEKFISNPFSEEPGGRLYKTGDLARYLPDGNIEFLGRIDDQVKIRGFRVEPGEIEAVLGQHPAVQETVVLSKGDTAGDQRLVAYMVSNQQPPPTISELRGFLREQMPDYMVPSAFVIMDALPLTPNGKADRRALLAAGQPIPVAERAYVPPRTPTEETLVGVWAEILGVDRVGVEDDFFELGGHSLLATRVISRVLNSFQVELPVRSLFEAPTIADMAVVIAQNQANQAEEVDVARLLAELEALSDEQGKQLLAEESAPV